MALSRIYDGTFSENSTRLLAIDYFRKKFHQPNVYIGFQGIIIQNKLRIKFFFLLTSHLSTNQLAH